MHPVGIDVIVTKNDGTEQRTKTCSAAYLLSASCDNIQVEFDKGMGGDCDLTRLDVQYRAVILLENGCYALERVREA